MPAHRITSASPIHKTCSGGGVGRGPGGRCWGWAGLARGTPHREGAGIRHVCAPAVPARDGPPAHLRHPCPQPTAQLGRLRYARRVALGRKELAGELAVPPPAGRQRETAAHVGEGRAHRQQAAGAALRCTCARWPGRGPWRQAPEDAELAVAVRSDGAARATRSVQCPPSSGRSAAQAAPAGEHTSSAQRPMLAPTSLLKKQEEPKSSQREAEEDDH